MSDDPSELHAIADDGEEVDVEDLPETAGPVEQATPGSGALGRPDLGANPLG